MRIVEDLGSCVKWEDVKSIYSKGNKIAISFNEDTTLCLAETCTNGEVDADIDLQKATFVDGVGIIQELGSIGCLANGTPLVLEKVFEDTCGILAEFKPFTGIYADYTGSVFLYDDKVEDKIADRVFEVEV